MEKQIYDINYTAYKFELIENTSELFCSDIINATYILHLEDNGRLEHILDQISKFKICKKIFILYNKGYKKSKKQKYINKPPLDLIDTYITAFKHATNNNFKNILIFEDDFICDKKLLDPTITNDICSFIKKNKHKKIIYHLGVIPLLLSETTQDHQTIYCSLGSHAVIYTSPFIEYILSLNQESIEDWDVFLNKCFLNGCFRYIYKNCLCYQTFPETDNSKYWGILDDIFISSMYRIFFYPLTKNFIKIIQLDNSTNIEKKYAIIYKHCPKIFDIQNLLK